MGLIETTIDVFIWLITAIISLVLYIMAAIGFGALIHIGWNLVG
jgi:uncharacterized membrane protein YkvI